MLGIFKRDGAPSKKELKHNLYDLLNFLVEKVPDDKQYSILSARVTKFTSMSADKQLQQLPETYLLLEQYITELDSSTIKSREDVRQQVQEKYPFASDIDSLRIIFQPRERQPIELAKVFIQSVLGKAYQLLGSAGDKMLVSLQHWLENVPDTAFTPIPFKLKDELPQNNHDWYLLLFDISHTLFLNLEEKFSENFTRKIYEKSYEDIARGYKGLEDFSMMIELLPRKILDSSQIDILSKKNKENVLTGRVETLTDLNEKITRQARELQEANDLISKKNDEITESIDYAKRIQFSMMPEQTHFKKLFKDSFIFFKPRDIVSGDFYWFKKLDYKDPKYVIAAVDCTGHGVPGAFMSMLGIEHLERIVSMRQILDPSQIALRLHKAIVKTLKRDREEIQDGMDLSICTVNTRNKTLEFTGAKNNLVFFQKGNLKVFRGDRQSIGEEHEGKEPFFTRQIVKLTPGTVCYIFSDGFEDQIGGRLNKKYKRVRFMKFLEQIHELPMKEQKMKLEEELHRWMNFEEKQYPQIDDILVMGYRIDF